MHNCLFVMSFSGSMILLLYLLTYPIAKRYFSLAWRYCVLKIALAFYLIPFPICISRVRVLLHKILPHTVYVLNKSEYFLNTAFALYKSDDFIYVSSEFWKMLVLMFLFGIISFTLILRQILSYWKVRKICLKHSYRMMDKEWQRVFDETKSELKIGRNINFLYSEYCKTPIAMGILFPVILVPPWNEDEVNKDLYRNVLKHEFVHIRHGDLLIKFIGMMVMAVHWFNPLTYILYHEISNISEMYCDSVVLRGKGENIRQEYSELLLRLAAKENSIGDGLTIGIIGGNNKRALKRRILEMKTVNKNKRILSMIMLVFICMTGGISVCAYDAPAVITNPNETFSEQRFDFHFTVGELRPEMEPLPSDYFFVDESGNIYDLTDTEGVSRTSCAHNYVKGTLTSHKKNNSGGCTVIYYGALRCTICGNVKTGQRENSVSYEKCPH